MRRIPKNDLYEFFPRTAEGSLQPQVGEDIFWAGGIGYVGPTDGTMVPVHEDGLVAMPDNIWTPEKIQALVDAAESGEEPLVDPGYANLWLEHGILHALVRDGNHRTFAALEAGESFSWVLMSDHTRQNLDLRETPTHDALYRAIRKAQREHGAPLLKRRRVHIRMRPVVQRLLELEQEHDLLLQQREDVTREMLAFLGPLQDVGFTLEEQLRDPHRFIRSRYREIGRWKLLDLMDDPVWDALVRREDVITRRLTGLDIYDARKAAGLNPARERLDPKTRLVVLL